MNNNKKILFFLICLGNITISFNNGAVAAAVPIISADLGLSDILVARVVPFYMIPYGLGALLYAPLTRYVSYRIILVCAMAVYALMSLVAGLSNSLESMLMAQIGAGIVAASSTPLSLMIIGQFFEKEIRGRLVGAYFGCSFFASLIGMFFMGIVDWRWLFFIPAILGTLTAFSISIFDAGLLKERHEESVNYVKAFLKDHIRRVFILIFVMSALYHAVHKWYGVFLSREYGLDKTAISFILIGAALCGLVGQQVGGFLSDKKGRLFTCYVGVITLSVGILGLSMHYPLCLVVIFLGMIAFGWTISHNSVSTALTDFPDEDRPIIASLNSSVRFVSGGLGFYISSFFVAKSFSFTFLIIGLLMIGSLFHIKNIIISDIKEKNHG